MPQENYRSESPGPELFLDFWGFVEVVPHLGQQNVYFQSRCIVRVDLNRQRNTYRGRISPSNLTVDDRTDATGDSVAEPLHILILLFPYPRPCLNQNQSATAVGPLRDKVNLHLIRFHGKCEASRMSLPIRLN